MSYLGLSAHGSRGRTVDSSLQRNIGDGLDELHAAGGEAVEGAAAGSGVGAKVGNVDPIANVHLGELLTLQDAVEGVAGGAVDSRDVRRGLLIGLDEVELGVGVVEDDAVEGVVEAVVDIVLILLLTGVAKGDAALGVDVDGEHVAGGGEVAAGLGDDGGAVEVLLEEGADVSADLLEAELLRLAILVGLGVGAGPAAAEVEKLHLEAQGSAVVKDSAGVHDGAHVRVGVVVAGADVEGDADDLYAKLLSALEHRGGVGHRSAKLGGEGADGVLIVGLDAEDGLAAGHVHGELLELINVVKGNVADALRLGDAHAAEGLAGVGEDDLVGGGVLIVDNHLDLSLRGTIKVPTEGRDHRDEGLVVVALNGVVGVHHREVLLELGHLNHHAAKVDDVKGVKRVEVGVGIGNVVAGYLAPPAGRFAEAGVGHGGGGILLKARLNAGAEVGVLLEEIADELVLGGGLGLGERNGLGVVNAAGVQRRFWHGAQNGGDEIGGRLDERWGVVNYWPKGCFFSLVFRNKKCSHNEFEHSFFSSDERKKQNERRSFFKKEVWGL